MPKRHTVAAAVAVLSVAATVTLAGPAPAARAEVGAWDLISVGNAGESADGRSSRPTLSADGQVIAFVTLATTLLPGLDGQRHVLVRDRSSAMLRRAGLAPDGTALSWSDNPGLSADGRWLAFCGPGTDGVTAYLRDLTAGVTTAMGASSCSPEPSVSAAPSVTPHGEQVAFAGPDSDAKVVIWDRATGTSRTLDVPGESHYLTTLRLVDGGRLLAYDVSLGVWTAVVDVATGEEIFQRQGDSYDPFAIDDAGTVLVYDRTDPEPGQPARLVERDLRTGVETPLDALGADLAHSAWLTMSPDGRFVAVSDWNPRSRVLDRSTGAVSTGPVRVEDLSDATGAGPTAATTTYEAFTPGDTNNQLDVYTARLVPDSTPPTLSLGPDRTVTEGAVATLPITLSRPTGEKVTIWWTTADGTARGDTDYEPHSAYEPAVIWPGQTTAMLTVATRDDTQHETPETFAVQLVDARGATVARSTATVGIVDDDPAPELVVDDPTVFEGYTGTTTAMVFTLRLSTPSGLPVTVTACTSDDSARTGQGDYTPLSTTVTIPAGERRTTVTVPVRGDDRRERNERLHLTLSAATGATLTDPLGVGTIVNDD